MATKLPTVYRLAASEETWHQRLWIAQLWGGKNAAISHASAAALYELDDFARGVAELMIPREGTIALGVSSSIDLAHALATCAWSTAAEDAAECAIYKGVTTARKLLDRIHAQAGSAALRRFWRLVRAAGLVPPLVRQCEVRIAGKRFFLDAAIPGLRIAVELDGLAKRTSRSATVAEYERQNLLIVNGWAVLRFTWDQVVNHPETVVQAIRDAIAFALAAG